MYTYESLCQDAECIPAQYPGAAEVRNLGITADERKIYDFVVGDPCAPGSIFINGGIHGREYMTSELVMKQMKNFLQRLFRNEVYQGISYENLLHNISIHVVPMVNPDGVTISQSGMEGVRTGRVKRNLEQIARLDGQKAEKNYFVRWKANGNGVDLNRNFDALWKTYEGPLHPSSEGYKGTYPCSESEAEALVRLTEREHFVRTISYHAQGNVIYWYFAQRGRLYVETQMFGERISHLTGYPLDGGYEALDPAGYKDWAICQRKIPSLTIEIGQKTTPVPQQQFAEIWRKNKFVWEETILNMEDK